jgi:hypothetical protein
MGRWERFGSPLLDQVYRQIVREGFVLTQGTLHLSFDDHPFGNLKPIYPAFQLLMVHKNHPIEIADGGRFSVSPHGDKRLPGDFTRDPNPNVYDSVTFFLAPYRLNLKPDYPGKMDLIDGFITLDNKKNLASLVYVGERGFNIDGQHASTVSTIIPSQIPAHFNYWLYHLGRAQAYDPEHTEWKDIGRFDLKETAQTAYRVALELETRFKTRILTKKPV